MEILASILTVLVIVLVLFILNLLRINSKSYSNDLKAEFQSLSQTTLKQVTDQFLVLAEERFTRLTEAGAHDLHGKKVLIDQQLKDIKTELDKVTGLVHTFEKDRETKFGQLTTEIRVIGKQAHDLTYSTSTLKEALASSRSRGQWGERMAEDILRLMGFVRGKNYEKQKSGEDSGSRPDFVFFLPDRSKINMDVKFPLDNYLRYLEASSDTDKTYYQRAFFKDVKAKINEVSKREYIDPKQGTVDYVLLFIPNESVNAFIHENDPTILDSALQKKVIWCSPLTLYCVLAVVRQAVDNFALKETSDQIISMMGSFKEQWEKFLRQMQTLGNRLSAAQKEFDDLGGARRRGIERIVNQIEQLQDEGSLPLVGQEAHGTPSHYRSSIGASGDGGVKQDHMSDHI